VSYPKGETGLQTEKVREQPGPKKDEDKSWWREFYDKELHNYAPRKILLE
jgi:hypothetical protein